MNSADLGRLDHLQALRGLAAMLVVLFHLTRSTEHYLGAPFMKGVFGFGWAGVELFFVLSGFLMVATQWGKTPSLGQWGEFIRRRFIRIVPLYLAVTLTVLPFHLFLGVGEAYKQDPGVILRSLLLLPQAPGQFPLVTVGWSLSHEVLFYLVFSLMLLLPPWGFRAIFGAWCLATVSVILFPVEALQQTSLRFLLSPYNLDFALGCAAAFIMLTHRRGGYWALGLGGLAFLGLGIISNMGGLSQLEASSSLLFASAAMLVIFGAAGVDLTRRFKVPRFLLLLGDASYSLYLTHVMVLNVALFAVEALLAPTGGLAFGLSLVVLALTVLVGIAVYHWVERPLIEGLRIRFLRRRTPPTVVLNP